MIGAWLAIDTSRYFVVCVNSLGSCFGSTGPACINPATGEPYRLIFPRSRSRTSRARVSRRAGARHRAAAARSAPRSAARSCGVCGAVSAGRAAPDQHFGFRGRLAVRDCAALGAARSDPARSGLAGRQLSCHIPAQRHARGAQARHHHLSISDRMAQRFGRDPIAGHGPDRRPVRTALCGRGLPRGAGRALHARFDPNCYLYLSRAMDRFDLAEHGGSNRAALAAARRPAEWRKCW